VTLAGGVKRGRRELLTRGRDMSWSKDTALVRGGRDSRVSSFHVGQAPA